jgi:lysozyme
MAKKRRKKKKRELKPQSRLLLVITILAILCLGYVYFPLIMNYIREPELQGKEIEEYRKDLPEYSAFGIDISHYQKDINWNKIFKEQKIDFVIIRATAGIDNFDRKFIKNWKAVKDAGAIRGAYHYYRPDENSKEQADFFIKNVNLQEGDLPPILDIEKYSRVQSLTSLKNGLLNWLQIVEEYYGITPIIYTYNKFYINSIIDDERFKRYPIWIAWYNINKRPDSVLKDWIFWQFTDKGKIKGIDGDVDINVFNGKIQELDGLRLKY